MKVILDINSMEAIKGGTAAKSFCAGFDVGAVVYEVGVLANWWNPVGWIGQAAIAVVGAGCVAVALS